MRRGPGASATQSPGENYVRDKAVVLLFLAGGPSQFETFDPKPNGPEGCTSINGHIQTSLPGMRFSGYLPRLAWMADRLSIARSFQTRHAERNTANKPRCCITPTRKVKGQYCPLFELLEDGYRWAQWIQTAYSGLQPQSLPLRSSINGTNAPG